MSEINYSKKQIQPLVEKFKINVETNAVFNRIISMFEGQANYQVWAIKAVFGRQLLISDMDNIKTWSDANQTLIKELSKKNIVSYTTQHDFDLLRNEMKSLDMISFVKNCINKFNTAQREMLRSEVFKTAIDSMTATNNPVFFRWFELFKKFESLADHRKKKVISGSSAFSRISDVKSAIETALSETYDWNKEDLLSYIERNANDCQVIYNEGNVVVVNVTSFESSKKLGGNGRTQWCLTREDRYFKQYVLEPRGNKQYFLFNFSKKEQDELAYIGFTVNENNGICNAHSTKNNSLLGEGIRYNNYSVNINRALQISGVSLGTFLRLKDLRHFKWDIEQMLAFMSLNKSNFSIVSGDNNRLIVRPMTNDALNQLIAHTLIDNRQYALNNTKNKVYVIMDLNLKQHDDKSVIVMDYRKDAYEIDTLNTMRDAYGTDIKNDGYLETIGISPETFLNREAIDPGILLHKLIDEKAEQDAINLINKQGEKFNVNFDFNQRVPVFSAVNNKMYRLFEAIINHPQFDSSTQDGLCEPLLQSLLYPYMYYNENKNQDEVKALKKMIETILVSTVFDYNAINLNLDTAINVACENACMNWVVAALVAKSNVNINVVNDFNCAALGNAIRNKNIDAIKLLSKRSDLVVREEDKELAAKHGVNLNELLSAEAFANTATATVSAEANDYSKVFEKVFAKR